jgi:hypothetical protein
MKNPFSDIVHKHFVVGNLIPLNGLEFVIKDNVNGEIVMTCRGMTRSMQKKMKARVDEKIKQKEFKFVETVTQQPVEKKGLLGKFFQRKTGE